MGNRLPRIGAIRNLRNEVFVADTCVIAESFMSRAVGLIGRRQISRGEGLLLKPCNSIHMWFMRVAIDVAFLKRLETNRFQVTSIHHNLYPWRVFPVGDSKADDTLELPSGMLKSCSVEVGDILCLS